LIGRHYPPLHLLGHYRAGLGQLPASNTALPHALKDIARVAMSASGNIRLISLRPRLGHQASAARMISPCQKEKIRGSALSAAPRNENTPPIIVQQQACRVSGPLWPLQRLQRR